MYSLRQSDSVQSRARPSAPLLLGRLPQGRNQIHGGNPGRDGTRGPLDAVALRAAR